MNSTGKDLKAGDVWCGGANEQVADTGTEWHGSGILLRFVLFKKGKWYCAVGRVLGSFVSQWQEKTSAGDYIPGELPPSRNLKKDKHIRRNTRFVVAFEIKPERSAVIWNSARSSFPLTYCTRTCHWVLVKIWQIGPNTCHSAIVGQVMCFCQPHNQNFPQQESTRDVSERKCRRLLAKIYIFFCLELVGKKMHPRQTWCGAPSESETTQKKATHICFMY